MADPGRSSQGDIAMGLRGGEVCFSNELKLCFGDREYLIAATGAVAGYLVWIKGLEHDMRMTTYRFCRSRLLLMVVMADDR